MTLAALIFDVDGTLAETEEVHRRAFNESFAAQGLDWHWDRETYARLLRTTGGKERMRAFAGETGAQVGDDEIAAIHAAKTARYGALLACEPIALRPGVAALVERAGAAGLKRAIATTTTHANIDALCRSAWGVPAGAVFDVVAAGDEVARKKPAPDVYALALARLGLDPDACIALEDSANGVASARAAGLRVLAVPSLYCAGDDLSRATWQRPSLAHDQLPGPLAAALDAPVA